MILHIYISSDVNLMLYYHHSCMPYTLFFHITLTAVLLNDFILELSSPVASPYTSTRK